MSQSTRRTIIIASILILIAASVFGFMVYQVIAQGDKLTEQIALLEEQNAQEASYYSLVRLAEETIAERERLQKYFLQQESDSIDFLNHVESLAPGAGVILETNKLELVTEKEGGAAWIEASFSFTGRRYNVQNFVQILETLPYVQRLTTLDMNAQSSSDWQADVTMQVRVLTYDE